MLLYLLLLMVLLVGAHLLMIVHGILHQHVLLLMLLGLAEVWHATSLHLRVHPLSNLVDQLSRDLNLLQRILTLLLSQQLLDVLLDEALYQLTVGLSLHLLIHTILLLIHKVRILSKTRVKLFRLTILLLHVVHQWLIHLM